MKPLTTKQTTALVNLAESTAHSKIRQLAYSFLTAHQDQLETTQYILDRDLKRLFLILKDRYDQTDNPL